MRDVGLWQNYPHILVFQHQQCSAFYRRTWRCANFVQSGCLDETWALVYEPEIKRQLDEGHHRGSPRRQVSTESITHEGHDHFGIWQLRYSRLSSCSWGPHFQCHVLQIIPAVQSVSYTVEEMSRTSKQCNNLHDNATRHTAACVQNLLQQWGWEILQHHP